MKVLGSCENDNLISDSKLTSRIIFNWWPLIILMYSLEFNLTYYKWSLHDACDWATMVLYIVCDNQKLTQNFLIFILYVNTNCDNSSVLTVLSEVHTNIIGCQWLLFWTSII